MENTDQPQGHDEPNEGQPSVPDTARFQDFADAVAVLDGLPRRAKAAIKMKASSPDIDPASLLTTTMRDTIVTLWRELSVTDQAKSLEFLVNRWLASRGGEGNGSQG